MGEAVGAVCGFVFFIVFNFLSPVVVFVVIVLAGVMAYLKFFRAGGDDE